MKLEMSISGGRSNAATGHQQENIEKRIADTAKRKKAIITPIGQRERRAKKLR
ncbi:MAG: hypothetical protein GY757_11410 [bacterium]|nr:hypothetical protein [bacterium]